jgi:predicted DNA-binding protein
MKNDQQFSVRLPSDVLEELERIAQAEDRTVAAVIRRVLRAYIEERPA